MTDLAGQVVVVTGGGGGIGAAVAQRFAEARARVAVIDLSAEAADAVARKIGGLGIAGDVGDAESVATCARQIEQALGQVHVLVNCAALFQAPVPPEAIRMERWDAVLRVSLRGTYLTCAAFGGAMARRGTGAIVNIASVSGMISFPYHAYGPAKAGVISLTTSLAAEWGPRGVRVNAISPGFTLTPQVQKAIDSGKNPIDSILRTTPLARLVEPAEVAEAALFLASPAASAITGANLVVDCGWMAGVTWEPYGGLRTGSDADA